MNRKLVLVLVFLMLYGSFAVLLAKPVVANQLPVDDFTIRADGSIYPSTLLISTSDNVTYTLTGDIINDSIVIERNNIVVDGAGYIVEGITLSDRTNITIKNMTTQSISLNHYSNYNTISGNNITNNHGLGYSISLTASSSNNISGNNITDNGGGIGLYNSAGNSISGNNIIANNAWGIAMSYYSGNNTIYGNNITNNFSGIALDSSSNNNTIYHNNFMNNSQSSSSDSTNFWDNGSEGNYWSDYNGTDSNQDGIGDTPYVIDANNIDHYPLMVPYAIVPEFPLFLFLPLLVMAASLAVIVCKRKHLI